MSKYKKYFVSKNKKSQLYIFKELEQWKVSEIAPKQHKKLSNPLGKWYNFKKKICKQ